MKPRDLQDYFPIMKDPRSDESYFSEIGGNRHKGRRYVCEENEKNRAGETALKNS